MALLTARRNERATSLVYWFRLVERRGRTKMTPTGYPFNDGRVSGSADDIAWIGFRSLEK